LPADAGVGVFFDVASLKAKNAPAAKTTITIIEIVFRLIFIVLSILLFPLKSHLLYANQPANKWLQEHQRLFIASLPQLDIFFASFILRVFN
jgi:hypothetical protein